VAMSRSLLNLGGGRLGDLYTDPVRAQRRSAGLGDEERRPGEARNGNCRAVMPQVAG
jgi:hypothetical protein